MCPETTGKSLEEIDLIFAKQSVKDSELANEIIAHHHVHAEKQEIARRESLSRSRRGSVVTESVIAGKY